MIPALGQATLDLRLQDRDVRLLTYLIVSGYLDVREFRPLKEVVPRRKLKWGRTSLYHSLTRLAATGYLERSAPVPGEPREYRLVYSIQEGGHVRVGERTRAS